MNYLDLISSLKDQLFSLPEYDDARANALLLRAAILIENIFREKDNSRRRYLSHLDKIKFKPVSYSSSSEVEQKTWRKACDDMKYLLEITLEEVKTFPPDSQISNSLIPEFSVDSKNNVFIVHGHDGAMRKKVEETLKDLGFKPIVLGHEPSQGDTLIEKLTRYSQSVAFAIVLLSPDDIARSKKEPEETIRYRARQNVILELGFFMAELGRHKVAALYKEDKAFEMPSDFIGVVFIPFDSAGKWRFELIKEFRAIGLDADANKLL